MKRSREVSTLELVALHEDIVTLLHEGSDENDVEEFVHAVLDAMIAFAEEEIGEPVPETPFTLFRGDLELN